MLDTTGTAVMSARDTVLSASLNWWLILDGWLAEDRSRVLESAEDWDSEDILGVLGLGVV